MNVRQLTAAGGLVIALLTAGCATSVGGQAQLDPAAVVATTLSSADPTGTASESGTDSPEVSTDQSSTDPTTEQQSAPISSESAPPTGDVPEPTTDAPESSTSRASTGSRTTGGLTTVPTSIPGFSAACNHIVAGVSAFSALLSDASSGSATDRISQAKVDATLKALPTTGLPARAQKDVDVLRATAKAAAGKTITELAMTLTDGKTVSALQDLSMFLSTGCS